MCACVCVYALYTYVRGVHPSTCTETREGGSPVSVHLISLTQIPSLPSCGQCYYPQGDERQGSRSKWSGWFRAVSEDLLSSARCQNVPPKTPLNCCFCQGSKLVSLASFLEACLLPSDDVTSQTVDPRLFRTSYCLALHAQADLTV